MIVANGEAPDIEKLERSEFVLDTDEYAKLKTESDAQVSKVKLMGTILGHFVRMCFLDHRSSF